MENWLRKNREFLNLLAIERKLGCSRSTLSKVANSDKKLPKKWIEPLRELAHEMIPPFYSGTPVIVDGFAADAVELGELEKDKSTNCAPTPTDMSKGTKLDIQSMVDKQKKK